MDADSHGDKRTAFSLSSQMRQALAGWMRGQAWHRTTHEEARFDVCAYTQLTEGSTLLWLRGEDATAYSLPLLVEHTPSDHPGDSSPIFQGEGLWVRDACTCFAGQEALGNILGLDASYTQHFPQGGGQTNTSIRYENGEEAVILKIFRTFAGGHERDFLLTSLLARGEEGTTLTPGNARVLTLEGGTLAGSKPLATGAEILGFSHTYVRTGSTGWDLLLAELPLAQRERLASIVSSLGAFTAQLHAALATAGTLEVDSALSSRIRDAWRERAQLALATTPALEAFDGMAEMRYAACAHVRWPQLQLIHGDYHLGQVLFTNEASWIALDFEGEPLGEAGVGDETDPRTSITYAHHRLRADLALRDVAGILRSFHYVWFVVADANPGFAEAFPFEEFRDFVAENFFLTYGKPSDEEQVLLDALLVDKALYEARYETLYRPSWLHIPLDSLPYLTR